MWKGLDKIEIGDSKKAIMVGKEIAWKNPIEFKIEGMIVWVPGTVVLRC